MQASRFALFCIECGLILLSTMATGYESDTLGFLVCLEGNFMIVGAQNTPFFSAMGGCPLLRDVKESFYNLFSKSDMLAVVLRLNKA